MPTIADRRFAEILVRRGLVPESAVRGCLAAQADARRRGEERRLGGILLERGHLDPKALVAAILDVRAAILAGEEGPEDLSAAIVPALGEMLIAEGAIDEGQVREALAIQEALQEQGIRLRLGDVLVERGWVERAVVEAKATGQERSAGGEAQPRLPSPLGRVQALDPEDRRFANLALGRELVSRLQLHDACDIQAVYRKWSIEKRLYELLEELKYLNAEDSARLFQEIESEVPVRPRRLAVKARGKRIGEVALSMGLVEPAALDAALDLQRALAKRKFQRPLGSLLVEMGALSEGDLDRVLASGPQGDGKDAPVGEDVLRDRRHAWIGAGVLGVVLLGALAAFELREGPVPTRDAGLRTALAERPPTPRASRQDYERDMSGRGLVPRNGGWVTAGEARRIDEEEVADRRRAEGRVLHEGRWVLLHDLRHELQRKQAERLGLIEVDGEWYTPEEVRTLRGGDAPGTALTNSTVRPLAEAGGRLALQVAVEPVSGGERIHFHGRAENFPERTIVRVLLLARQEPPGRRLIEQRALCERGTFQGVLEPSGPPYFPDRYRLRVEADEIDGGIGAEVPADRRAAEAAEAFLGVREEVESSLSLLRSLLARSRRIETVPADRRPVELDRLAESMVDAALSPSADARYRGAPCREARLRVRSLPGSPWLDPERDLDALESELDRIQADLWTGAALFGEGLEGCRRLAATLASDARRVGAGASPDRSRAASAWFLAEELAGHSRDLQAAIDGGEAESRGFAGPWLGRLRALLGRCERSGDPLARAVADAIGSLAMVWSEPDAASREDLDRELAAIAADQADPRVLEVVLDAERARIRDLLAELADHAADEPEEWAAWSDDWTARVLRSLEDAAPTARSPGSAGPGTGILQAGSLLLEAREARVSVRAGGSPEAVQPLEDRIRGLLDR